MGGKCFAISEVSMLLILVICFLLPWQLIKMVVQPGPVDEALAKKKAVEKEKTHTQRLARRREKHAKKRAEHAASEGAAGVPRDDTEEHDSEEAIDDPMDDPMEEPEVDPRQAPKTRAEHVKELFGSVSDVSSDNSHDSQSAKVQTKVGAVSDVYCPSHLVNFKPLCHIIYREVNLCSLRLRATMMKRRPWQHRDRAALPVDRRQLRSWLQYVD